MKRTALLLVISLLITYGWSQTLNIHYKSGQSVQFDMQNIDYLEFTEKTNNNTTVTSGEAVDLGLSVLWAGYNVGATSCEQMGDKFAWGETETKQNFTKDNYLYYDNDMLSYVDIGTDISNTEFDAAHVNWSGSWRMPTRKEYWELNDFCSWEWVKINDVFGYKVTGKNGNSIFFPVGNNNYAHYWSSSLWIDTLGGKEKGAFNTALSQGTTYVCSSTYPRERGCYIRPVCPK